MHNNRLNKYMEQLDKGCIVGDKGSDDPLQQNYVMKPAQRGKSKILGQL